MSPTQMREEAKAQSIADALIAANRAKLEAQYDAEAANEGGAIRHFRANYALRRPKKPMAHCPPVAKQERSL